MRRFWVFIKFWLPPLLWMSLIFIGSADSGSVSRSSRLIEPFLRWLFPAMSDGTVGHCVLAARKCAHVVEYACCAILLWRAKRQYTGKDTRPWNPREAWWALAVVFAYACTDEIHQAFVPGRGAAAYDVLLDTLGAALGLVAVWWAGRISKRW